MSPDDVGTIPKGMAHSVQWSACSSRARVSGASALGMNKDHTLEEVGQQFSVTRERIRQIEAKALRKLKHPSRSRILRSFLHD